MIASFFQRLESSGVAYLLISGQATILYGAATFSEDVDLWLRPSAENVERFLAALHASSARYYKLTPPVTIEHLERGHGFHFVLPGAGTSPAVYLDVMGRPPRVEAFESALRDARYFDTDFGRVHTIGIKELVELKKTQRPGDYPIISRLAIAHLAGVPESERPAELVWALDNMFSLPELTAILREHAAGVAAIADRLPEPIQRLAAALATGQIADALEDEVDVWLDSRASALRRADRRYWKSIIDELRDLRRDGRLMPEGSPV